MKGWRVVAWSTAAGRGERRMGRPTGSADLPLHGGRVPMWLAARMARLGRVIAEAIVLEDGRDELLRRLGAPARFRDPARFARARTTRRLRR